MPRPSKGVIPLYEFTVNGKVVQTEKDMKLLPFLREELGLTSVKNGCSQGACGTCTVIVDGKAVKSCVLSTSKTVGKHILTCEGLSKAERDVWAYAFSKCGAVQCGFCTPGMIMACKALVEHNSRPGREDVVKAIRGNLCRCTGYKKLSTERFWRRECCASTFPYHRRKPTAPWVSG